MIQGSQEWIDARVGKVTASRVGDVFTQPRKGSSVSKVRESFLADLLAERLTGRPTVKNFGSEDDDGPAAWGRKMEPFARAAYEAKYGAKIDLAGFIDHPVVPMSGASPDGLVGSTGGVEIKCPNTMTHLATCRLNRVPTPYLWQMKWNMACTGAKWWDFISFDTRAESEPMWVYRVEPSEHDLRVMELNIYAFVMELEARLAAHHHNEEARYAQANV